jgi:hypothetical protein
MTRPTRATRNASSQAPVLALLVLAAGLLAGCETDGTGPSASGAPTAQTAMAPAPPEPGKPAEAPKPVQAAKPAEPPKVEPPMTRSRAATECWMKTEKGSAKTDIDKRADIVTKCIDDKMKAAAAAPKT